MTSDAIGDDFSLRAMAAGATRFRWHQHVGCFAALPSVMTDVAVQQGLRCRIDLVFGVIEIRLRHPAID